MPYENPGIGIRWSTKTSTFDDARAHLKSAPYAAGNTARTIMGIELAILAQHLKTRLPYLHRERNDHRNTSDFLHQLISDGVRCFQKKSTKDHEPYKEAIEALRAADRLLVSWANRASHTLDTDRREAEKLIEVCERALEFFDCPVCGKPVSRAEVKANESMQCGCEHLRWRYGKA